MEVNLPVESLKRMLYSESIKYGAVVDRSHSKPICVLVEINGMDFEHYTKTNEIRTIYTLYQFEEGLSSELIGYMSVTSGDLTVNYIRDKAINTEEDVVEAVKFITLVESIKIDTSLKVEGATSTDLERLITSNFGDNKES